MKKSSISRRINVFLLFVLIIVTYCYAQNNWIKVEKINIDISELPKELIGLKIAHISDVHLPKNASTIDNIVKKVENQNPDIIVLTGDLIDSSADINNCGLNVLCSGLSKIATTYAVTGNHEFWNGNVEKWKQILTDNNIKVIDNKIEIFTKNSSSIVIAGLQDGVMYDSMIFENMDEIKDMPMIFLAHRAELFSSYVSNENSIIPDLIFTGHAHGGQFRIPLTNKGVVSPNQGFFPKYTNGVYTKNNVNMGVSRGLGNSIIPIRLNNRPHLPVYVLNNTLIK